MYCTRKVNDDYTWVGADGRRLAMFEGPHSPSSRATSLLV